MRDYKDLISMISKIEEQDKKQKVNYVSMEIYDSVPITLEIPRNFNQLIPEVSRNDTFVAQKASAIQKSKKDKALKRGTIIPPEQFSPTPQPQAAIASSPKPMFSMPKFSAPQMPKFNTSQAKPATTSQSSASVSRQIQVPKPQAAPIIQDQPLAANAVNELNNIIATNNIEVPKSITPVKMKQAASKAILPTLSITDQISELEKITESLKNNNFDTYQMEIVREELFALSDVLSSQQPAQQIQGADQALENLRKSRLVEALSLLPQA